MPKPKIMLVGGADITARFAFMKALSADFEMMAAGNADLHKQFADKGFMFYQYELNNPLNPLDFFKGIRSLKKAIKAAKPDIVHTFDTKQSIIGRFAAKQAGVPYIMATLTGIGTLYVAGNTNHGIRKVYEFLQKKAGQLSAITIFQNHTDQALFIEKGIVDKNKQKVILGSGIDTTVLDVRHFDKAQQSAFRKRYNIPQDAIVVSLVTRLIKSKGALLFAQIAKELSINPKIHFVLAGQEVPESLEAFTKDEMDYIKTQVNLIGYCKDVPLLWASSDIALLPSTYREGIPRVLLEASALSLPCITVNSAGCNECVLNNKTGFVIDHLEANLFAEKILQLAQQPEIRIKMGENARELMVETFDLSHVIRQYKNVYQDILNH